jgi:hypothetical protein
MWKTIRIGDDVRRDAFIHASRLPPPGRSCKRTAMTMRVRSVASSRTGFVGETARALASTLLLLGLIGDRRVR